MNHKVQRIWPPLKRSHPWSVLGISSTLEVAAAGWGNEVGDNFCSHRISLESFSDGGWSWQWNDSFWRPGKTSCRGKELAGWCCPPLSTKVTSACTKWTVRIYQKCFFGGGILTNNDNNPKKWTFITSLLRSCPLRELKLLQNEALFWMDATFPRGMSEIQCILKTLWFHLWN